MKNTSKASGNGMDLGSSNEATSFVLSDTDELNNRFYFEKSSSGKYLQYSNSGGGIRLYTGKGAKPEESLANSQITITYADTPSDYYELDGKTYSIAYNDGDGSGIGLTSTATAQPVLIDNNSQITADNGTVARWTFANIGGASYTLSTKINGEIRYLY